jgi:hypothetical protein
MHSGDIELAVANLLSYRVQTIVPNVSWGLGLRHECDMLVLDNKNRFTEVEIKISIADLKADFKKKHGHHCKFISRLVYAIPYELLEKSLELIPGHCGIIVVKLDKKWNFKQGKEIICYTASWHRQCRHDKTKDKPSAEIIKKFYHLGCMRI